MELCPPYSKIVLPKCSIEVGTLRLTKPITFAGDKGTLLRVRNKIEINIDHYEKSADYRYEGLSSTHFRVAKLSAGELKVSFEAVALELSPSHLIEQQRTNEESYSATNQMNNLFHVSGKVILELKDCKVSTSKAQDCTLISLIEESAGVDAQVRPELKIVSSYISGFKSIGTEAFDSVQISHSCFESIRGTVLKFTRPKTVHIVKSLFKECDNTCIEIDAEHCQKFSRVHIEACDFKKNQQDCVLLLPNTFTEHLLEVKVEECNFSENISSCINALRSESTILKVMNCSFFGSKKATIEMEDCGQRSEIVSNYFNGNQGTCVNCIGSPALICYNDMRDNFAGIFANCTQRRAMQYIKYVDRFLNSSTDSMSNQIKVEIYKNTIKTCLRTGIELGGISNFKQKLAFNELMNCWQGILIDTLSAGDIPEERLDPDSASLSVGGSCSTSCAPSESRINLQETCIMNCKESCLRIADPCCQVTLVGGRFSNCEGIAISMSGKRETTLLLGGGSSVQTIIEGNILELEHPRSQDKSQCVLI